MRSQSLKQQFANPGLPGFARFGGLRFTRSRVLPGSGLGRPWRDTGLENFPVGKFSIAGVSILELRAASDPPTDGAVHKTFLQESICFSQSSRSFETAERAHRGGRVMPTTQ
jgi:hypothetical protein